MLLVMLVVFVTLLVMLLVVLVVFVMLLVMLRVMLVVFVMLLVVVDVLVPLRFLPLPLLVPVTQGCNRTDAAVPGPPLLHPRRHGSPAPASSPAACCQGDALVAFGAAWLRLRCQGTPSPI
jgi:hypothetical protein